MKIPKGQGLYFDEKLARLFSDREENYRHEQVSDIIAAVILSK